MNQTPRRKASSAAVASSRNSKSPNHPGHDPRRQHPPSRRKLESDVQGNLLQYLLGCSMVTGGLTTGPYAFIIVPKGVDEALAGLSGGETLVYQKAREAGLSEGAAYVIDFGTSCPELVNGSS